MRIVANLIASGQARRPAGITTVVKIVKAQPRLQRKQRANFPVILCINSVVVGLDIDIVPVAVLLAKLVLHRLALGVKTHLYSMTLAGEITQVALERQIRQAVVFEQLDIFGVEIGLGLKAAARKEEIAKEVVGENMRPLGTNRAVAPL